MKAVLILLRSVLMAAEEIHSPLSHGLIKEEKACTRCQFNAKLRKLISEGEFI